MGEEKSCARGTWLDTSVGAQSRLTDPGAVEPAGGDPATLGNPPRSRIRTQMRKGNGF